MAVQVPSVKETRADSFFRISVCGNPVFSTTNGNFKCGGFADLAHFSYSEHYTFVVTFAIYTFVGCADNPKIPAALTVTKYAGFFEKYGELFLCFINGIGTFRNRAGNKLPTLVGNTSDDRCFSYCLVVTHSKSQKNRLAENSLLTNI